MALLKLPPHVEGDYWRPVTDAQYTACWSQAQMLMFGGAAGPGKTSFIVADAVAEYDNSNLRSIVFRESYPQLEKSVMPKMRDIYTQMGAYYVDGRKRRWTFPSGALCYVGVIDKDSDVANYQGGEYCVAKGTPILMGDGGYKPIEDVVVGELVQTLEGPKPVTHTWRGMHKPCVEAKVWDEDGHYLGSQVHPETHPIMRFESWDSYVSLTSGQTCSAGSGDSLPETSRPQEWSGLARLYEPVPLSDGRRERLSTQFDSDCISSRQSEPTVAGHLPAHSDARQLCGPTQSSRGCNRARSAVSPKACALDDSRTTLGSRLHYSDGSHLCDEQLLSHSGTCLADAPLPGDVEEPDHLNCKPDGSDSIPQHSHPFCELEYIHPYTNEKRHASWASSVGALSMRPVGVREVCDLTVADVNHYITSCGLINRNSGIYFDESTHHAESHLRDLLPWFRSTDPSLRKRIRLATNPGGDGAPWHMHAFLRNRCPFHKPMECVEPGAIYSGSTWLSDRKPIPYTVSFIPGLHTDHSMHGTDYADSLRTQSGDRADQFLKGCWCSLQGAYFKAMHPEMIQPLPNEYSWWWTHYVGIDYGYGNSAAAAGLYCVSPPTQRFPSGQHFKIDEFVARETLSKQFAQAVGARFAVSFRGGPRKIVCAYIDPANDQHDGTGRSNMEIMGEELIKFGIPIVPASNDPLGGSMNLASMLASEELVLTPGAIETYRALSTRMHDPKRPGCYKKVHGAAEDDLADETRYATNTFTEESRIPRAEEIAQKVRALKESGMDEWSVMINSWRLNQETPSDDAPAHIGGSMGRRGIPVIRR